MKEDNKEELQTDDINPSIEELVESNKELKDKYLRLYAEFENHKKRSIKQMNDIKIQTKHSITKDLLDIFDDIMISRTSIDGGNVDEKSWIEGSLLIYDKLDSYINSIEIEEVICELGDSFDPDKHYCISVVSMGEENLGKIIDISKRGYMIDNKIVKYPQVIVGK